MQADTAKAPATPDGDRKITANTMHNTTVTADWNGSGPAGLYSSALARVTFLLPLVP